MWEGNATVVGGGDTDAIVDYFDAIETKVLEADLDAGRMGVEGVFYELFDGGGEVLRARGGWMRDAQQEGRDSIAGYSARLLTRMTCPLVIRWTSEREIACMPPRDEEG